MDDGLRQQRTTLDLLWQEHDNAARGVRGRIVFRKLLEGRDYRDGRLESKLEAKLLAILRRIKDFDFEVQYPITARGKKYRLDFVNRETQVAVEGKGVRWHLGNKQLDEDSDRHNDLSLVGLTLLYYTWDDVHFREQEVEDEVTEMLHLRRSALLVHHR
jgi:very-short-patch-repair endonuclease